jgi:4-hydroxymandelate oxidase
MGQTNSLNSVSDYEARAREILPPGLFPVLFGDYGQAGWEANTRNLDAFREVQLQPRVMVDISAVDTATTVLGTPVAVPILTGPAGLHQRFHAEGEVGTAKGTAAAGSLMVLSTAASYSVEEVAELGAGPRWFQLYCFKDRGLTEELVHRATAAGYAAICVTVDNPGVRSRERDNRHGFDWHGRDAVSTLDADRVLRNFHGLEGPGIPNASNLHECFETALDWDYFDWLRGLTPLPFVIKGIQTTIDAVEAVRHGAAGIVVSNHGGHALHDAAATVGELPEIADAVGGRAEVYLDSGVRRGIDVLKCLALGARAVLIGRAYLWGLAVGGAAGVEGVYDLLRTELVAAMSYCGVADVKAVPRSLVRDERRAGPASQLRELADLVDRGYLSREEFDQVKVALLGELLERPRGAAAPAST